MCSAVVVDFLMTNTFGKARYFYLSPLIPFLLRSGANQARYGPEKDRTHMDVTSLSDVYQWMQVCYRSLINVVFCAVLPFVDRVETNGGKQTVNIPLRLQRWFR